MGNPRHDPGLPFKTFATQGIPGISIIQHFQGHFPPQNGILRPEHHAHAAFSQFSGNTIRPHARFYTRQRLAPGQMALAYGGSRETSMGCPHAGQLTMFSFWGTMNAGRRNGNQKKGRRKNGADCPPPSEYEQGGPPARAPPANLINPVRREPEGKRRLRPVRGAWSFHPARGAGSSARGIRCAALLPPCQ